MYTHICTHTHTHMHQSNGRKCVQPGCMYISTYVDAFTYVHANILRKYLTQVHYRGACVHLCAYAYTYVYVYMYVCTYMRKFTVVTDDDVNIQGLPHTVKQL